MTHVCEMQNEVNPYIVQTNDDTMNLSRIGWFGTKPHPEAAQKLKESKTQNKAKNKKLAAAKARLRQLKATQQTEAEHQKIEHKNHALDAAIEQLEQQIEVMERQVQAKDKKGKLLVDDPPERPAPTVPPHRRIGNG